MIFNTWFGHAQIGHGIFNTWFCIAWPASFRALFAAFSTTYPKGAAEGRPLCIYFNNAAKNALNDAGHATQNHVLKIPCPIWPCPKHVLKIKYIKDGLGIAF